MSVGQEKIRDNILEAFKENGYQPPKREELENIIKGEKEEIEEVFISLLSHGDIIKLSEEVYLEKTFYELAKDKLKEFILENSSISIGEYRDLLNTNRRVSLSLLEYFDQIKLTKRLEDKRVLCKW